MACSDTCSHFGSVAPVRWGGYVFWAGSYTLLDLPSTMLRLVRAYWHLCRPRRLLAVMLRRLPTGSGRQRQQLPGRPRRRNSGDR